MASLRIRNTTILTQNAQRNAVQGDLYVEDGRVVHVGQIPGRKEADRTLDGTGQVVLPGLINLHTHLAMTLLRGFGDDMLLEPWLKERIWPAEDRLTAESMRAGADLGLLEMVASGTTSFLDMYFMEEEVMAPACRAAGVRAWLGEGMVDAGRTEPDVPNAKLPAIERFVKATAKDPLVRGCPAPHAPYTCHPVTYQESGRIAREHGVPMHTHCSETRKEVYDLVGKTGKRPLQYVADAGALLPQSVLAHCGWITKQEVQDISKAKAGVAHCPVSNLKLATGGVTPIPELHDAQVKVGLGTDGAASNNTLDMVQTMKFAALVQKQHRWDATALPAQRVLDMATRDAADALHRKDLGRIEPGATADLVLVDFRRPHLVPRHDAASHLVYSASGRDVSATIVQGKLLYEAGTFHTLDAAQVMAKAEKAAAQIGAAQAPSPS